MTDADAIREAAVRPRMHYVHVKSEETQRTALVFHFRDLFSRQRTQAINSLRGHLGEFVRIVPQAADNRARLIAIIEDPDGDLPADAIATLEVLAAALRYLEAEIGNLGAEINRWAKDNEVARRLMTIPGIGPMITAAIATLPPPPELSGRGGTVQYGSASRPVCTQQAANSDLALPRRSSGA